MSIQKVQDIVVSVADTCIATDFWYDLWYSW